MPMSSRALAPSAGSNRRCPGGWFGTNPKSAETWVTDPIAPLATRSTAARIAGLQRIHIASMKK